MSQWHKARLTQNLVGDPMEVGLRKGIHLMESAGGFACTAHLDFRAGGVDLESHVDPTSQREY